MYVPAHGTEQLSCESRILIPWVDNIYACVLTFEDFIRLIYRSDLVEGNMFCHTDCLILKSVKL